MNPRERLLAAMRREVPDRVPYEFYLTPALQRTFHDKTGAQDPAIYYNFEERHVRFHTPVSDVDYRHYYPEGLSAQAWIDGWGVAQEPGSEHHFLKMVHPLRRATMVEEILDYPLPDLSHVDCWLHLKSEVADLHARGLAAHALLGMTLFEISWYIRGMENLFVDMVSRPEMSEALLERITELRIFQAKTYARADVDILRLGDDVAAQRGMLMSPAMWRQWLKPRLARVIQAARSVKPDILIWYHSDGDCRAVIPELIEIGVNILNPVQPECMDPAAIKVQYGDRLSFAGTIGTQTTMPYGTPAEIKATVKKRMATAGQGGGLLLAPSHVLEPDVPWENVVALIEAIEAYGWY